MVWSVDRSSPSSKIRDFMHWSHDIIKDIYYQRKVLNNPFTKFLIKQWPLWNKLCMLLSLAINILMLVTWEAPLSLGDLKTMYRNTTAPTVLPPLLYHPRPKITMDKYTIVIYALGGTHNFLSLLVLISYFLSNHPTLPSISNITSKLRGKCCCSHKENEENQKKAVHESKLEVEFFSITTLYYLIFVGMSAAGTVFQGYFFAFHLLNIVHSNQLLKGVINAVGQNGKSLLWVGVLGLVIFYLYALVSFALMRSSFNPEEELYCATLFQCTVTIIHYGLIGKLFDTVVSHPYENSFLKFGMMAIFHISFFIFITTIGLNIVLGIIVDTFSELRDLKWTAERDMRDNCFICSRPSYDFEHHGQGFEHHINVEHNIWAYIFFFMHLNDTKRADYTAIELYVQQMLDKEQHDFFPLNRALSLQGMDSDSTESKVDDLLKYILILVERQKQEDAQKHRDEERRKQLRWRKEQTNMLNNTDDRPDDDDDDDHDKRDHKRKSDDDDDDDEDYDDKDNHNSKQQKRMHKQKQWRRASQRGRYGDESKDASFEPVGQPFSSSVSRDDLHDSAIADTLPLDCRKRAPPVKQASLFSDTGHTTLPSSEPFDDVIQLIDFDDDMMLSHGMHHRPTSLPAIQNAALDDQQSIASSSNLNKKSISPYSSKVSSLGSLKKQASRESLGTATKSGDSLKKLPSGDSLSGDRNEDTPPGSNNSTAGERRDNTHNQYPADDSVSLTPPDHLLPRRRQSDERDLHHTFDDKKSTSV